MSFRPTIPLSGIGGWQLLKRVEGGQREVFARRPDVARNAEAFIAGIGDVRSPEALLQDRRLLEVALGAFGLEEEIGKRAFIRRALESDPFDPQSFVGRLVDVRYKRMAEAFGFGSPFGPETSRPGFAARIADAYRERAFEKALGESDPALRLALNARRELAAYGAREGSDAAGWFALLGDRPVRRVLEGALGLPTSFGQLDVDRQRDEMRSRTRDLVGDDRLSAFADPDVVETVIRRFLAREAASSGPSATTPGVAALTVLGSGFGPSASRGLVLSRI